MKDYSKLDYSKLSDEELSNSLDKLEMSLAQDEAMDGSGELGGIIYKGYEPYFNAIYAEMDKRGLEVSLEDSNV